MANSDSAQYVLRYNEISGDLEAQIGLTWTTLLLANAGGITQLTGDVTAGPGSGSQATTLATVNSNVGSFTSANITVDGKGRITAAANGSSGSVPNVVMATATNQNSVGINTYGTTQPAVTITPSSASAKIKVTFVGVLEAPGITGYATIFKDGANVVADQMTFTTLNQDSTCLQWLDTPGDTSPHTYAVAIKSPNADGNTSWGGNSATKVAIAEEIH